MQENSIKRLVAIGDIHGHAMKLEGLLSQVRPTNSDQLVFLGDYIDRGPQSRSVLDRLIGIQEEFPQTIFLRGNHEQLFLDAMASQGMRQEPTLRDLSVLYRQEAVGPNLTLFLANGGGSTMNSYDWDWGNIPKSHIGFLERTMLWWRYKEYLFVHAGCLDEEPDTQDAWVFLWSRQCDPGRGGEIHVVGHSPIESGYPLFEPGRYMLDTGSAYGGPLTACDVFTREIWQAT